MELTEKIWFAEYKTLQTRAKPGKALRRAYSQATDGQIQDLAAYFHTGNSVEVSNAPAVWVEAYEVVSSCMRGKGALCQRAYTPHGVSIAVLRSSKGAILSRALVRRLESGAYVACRGYGAISHQLMAVLQFLGEVQLTADWMKDIKNVFTQNGFETTQLWFHKFETISVKTEIVFSGSKYSYCSYEHKFVGMRCIEMRRPKIFRPYVDGGLGH